MTKKDMAYEIISNTNFSAMDEREVNKVIARTPKAQMIAFYHHFKENPTTKRAEFVWTVVCNYR